MEALWGYRHTPILYNEVFYIEYKCVQKHTRNCLITLMRQMWRDTKISIFILTICVALEEYLFVPCKLIRSYDYTIIIFVQLEIFKYLFFWLEVRLNY